MNAHRLDGSDPAAPAISVIVPVYRIPEKYLRPSAESLRAQSLQRAEFLFVLDGPDPGAEAVLRDVFRDDSRFSLTVLPSNGGVSRARNAALGKVRGSLFCFVDADDLLPAGVLQAVADEMARHPETDIFIGPCGGKPADLLVQRRCVFAPPGPVPACLSDEALARFTVWGEAWGAGKFYSARLLPHSFPEDLGHYEDTCFAWQALGKASTAGFLPFQVYTIVGREDSTHRTELSATARENALQGLRRLALMPLPRGGGPKLLRIRRLRLFIELFESVLFRGLPDDQAAALLPAAREVAGILQAPPYPRLSAPLRWLVRRRLSSPGALARPGRIGHVLWWDAYRAATAPWRNENRFLTALAVAVPPLYRLAAPRFKPVGPLRN